MAIKITAGFLVLYFFYSLPASFTTAANEKLEFFSENRQLTRELIRAGRIDKSVKLPPMPPSTSSLERRVDEVLKKEAVLPEQKMSAIPKSNIASKMIVPKSIKQGGIKASVKTLNLRQAIRVGESLGNIKSGQLMNMFIQADSKDPHYFNVEYEVATFDVPRTPIESSNSKKNKRKKKRSKKRKNRKKNQ